MVSNLMQGGGKKIANLLHDKNQRATYTLFGVMRFASFSPQLEINLANERPCNYMYQQQSVIVRK